MNELEETYGKILKLYGLRMPLGCLVIILIAVIGIEATSIYVIVCILRSLWMRVSFWLKRHEKLTEEELNSKYAKSFFGQTAFELIAVVAISGMVLSGL